MNYKLPSYEDCVKIVEENENFYENVQEIDGVAVSVFNYRLASYTDFVDPLGMVVLMLWN